MTIGHEHNSDIRNINKILKYVDFEEYAKVWMDWYATWTLPEHINIWFSTLDLVSYLIYSP